jgi:hypothetical protein
VAFGVVASLKLRILKRIQSADPPTRMAEIKQARANVRASESCPTGNQKIHELKGLYKHKVIRKCQAWSSWSSTPVRLNPSGKRG